MESVNVAHGRSVLLPIVGIVIIIVVMVTDVEEKDLDELLADLCKFEQDAQADLEASKSSTDVNR